MSNTNQTPAHIVDHGGPIKPPKQLMVAVLVSFIVPIGVIASLAYLVASSYNPHPGSADLEQSVTARIQKVGRVEFRDTNREMKTGQQVFAAQCTACHTAGVAGAPKFGDAAAWGPRIKTGFEALVNAALKGKNAMGPQGGGDFDNFEIARAVVYMANAGGANFAEPAKPAPVK
jgi:cytochrome c5